MIFSSFLHWRALPGIKCTKKPVWLDQNEMVRKEGENVMTE